MTKKKLLLVVLLICLLAIPEIVYATTATPFDTTIEKIIQFLTGSFAKGISIAGLVITVGALMFSGGELSSFGRSLIFTLLGITVLIFSTQIINSFVGGFASALIK